MHLLVALQKMLKITNAKSHSHRIKLAILKRHRQAVALLQGDGILQTALLHLAVKGGYVCSLGGFLLCFGAASALRFGFAAVGLARGE